MTNTVILLTRIGARPVEDQYILTGQILTTIYFVYYIAKPITIYNIHNIQYTETIQGVSRLVDITAGGDSLGLCDQKSSYKHVSDFGRLRSYDRLKLRIESEDY